MLRKYKSFKVAAQIHARAEQADASSNKWSVYKDQLSNRRPWFVRVSRISATYRNVLEKIQYIGVLLLRGNSHLIDVTLKIISGIKVRDV